MLRTVFMRIEQLDDPDRFPVHRAGVIALIIGYNIMVLGGVALIVSIVLLSSVIISLALKPLPPPPATALPTHRIPCP